MSILEWQCYELRRLADKLGNDEEVSVPFVRVLVIPIMREAADTIESLRDRLQAVGDQACHATQANYEHCKYSTDRGWCDTSRYSELFGTPERAARVIVALNHCRVVCCEECAARGACRYDGCGDDYDALLEWLRGDAE